MKPFAIIPSLFLVFALAACSGDDSSPGTDATGTTTGSEDESCETLLNGESGCADAGTLIRCVDGFETTEFCGPGGEEGGILDLCDNSVPGAATCVTATSVCFQRCVTDGGKLDTCSSYTVADETTSLYQTDEQCAADAAALCATAEPGSTAEYVLTTETECCSDNCDPSGFAPVP